MLKKAKAQVADLYKDLQKGIEGQIFGFVEGYIVIENLQRQFFSKSERLFKKHILKLRNFLEFKGSCATVTAVGCCAYSSKSSKYSSFGSSA